MNLIQNKEYLNEIQHFIETSQTSEVTEDDLLTQLFSNRISMDVEDSNFSENVKKVFQNISKIEPGRKLLQRIISCGENFEIFQTSGDCCAFPFKKLLALRFDRTYFHMTLNEKGDRELFAAPIESVVAHECIHILHHSENPTRSRDIYTSKCLIDSEFDNEEEQLTISGLSPCTTDNTIGDQTLLFKGLTSKNEIFALTDLCCENSFLRALGYPLRINHHGLSLNSDTSLNVIDMVRHNAIGNLTKLLMDNPENLNNLHDHPQLPKISLLSAAAYYGHGTCIDFLLSKGAKMELHDEIGGVLMAAIKGGFDNALDINWQLALKLIDKGASVSMKDAKGKTSLDLFNEKPKCRFCLLKKPIINRIKEQLTSLPQK